MAGRDTHIGVEVPTHCPSCGNRLEQNVRKEGDRVVIEIRFVEVPPVGKGHAKPRN